MRVIFFSILVFISPLFAEEVVAQENVLNKIWEVRKSESVIDYSRSFYSSMRSGKKAFITNDFQEGTYTSIMYDSLGTMVNKKIIKDLDWGIPYKIYLADSSIVVWNEQYKNMEKYEMKFILRDSLSINYDCTPLGRYFYTYKVQRDTLVLTYTTIDPPDTQKIYFVEQRNETVPDFKKYKKFECIQLHAPVKSSLSNKRN